MSRHPRPDGALTPRQFELFVLLRQERLTFQQIADRLVVQPDTIRTVANKVYGRLGIRGGRRELIARYGGEPCCPTCGQALPTVTVDNLRNSP